MSHGLRAGAVAACVIYLLGSGWVADAHGQPGNAPRDGPAARADRWSGLYVGAHAGFATGTTEADFPAFGMPGSDISLDGALYGGHLGYNLQFGSAVLGIEGGFSGAGISGSSSCLVLLTCEREVEWLATVAGRFGYVMDRAMLYATAGIAWSELATAVSLAGCTCLTGSETNQGWLVGFGVEYAVTARLSGRVEYVHVDLGNRMHTLEPPGGGFPEPARVGAGIDTLRLGASIKLSD